MDIDSAYPGKYLKATDVPESGVTWTIKTVRIEELGQGDEAEQKPVVYFNENETGLSLNKTNKEIIKALYGRMTENWTGKPVIVYNDVTVMNKGQRVGGVRLRAPVNDGHNVPSLDDLKARYFQRANEAAQLGVLADTLPDDATSEQVIAAGKKLKALIDKANEF